MIGDGLAYFISDLGPDGRELFFSIDLGEHEGVAIGSDELFGLFLLVDHCQGLGIIHLGYGGKVGKLHAVHQGQSHEGQGSSNGTDENEGSPASQLMGALVGDSAEQRQHEQGQHVVQRHDETGPGLAHAKLVGQNQGDGVVIGLPESADQKERKADADCTEIIQFHLERTSFRESCDLCYFSIATGKKLYLVVK